MIDVDSPEAQEQLVSELSNPRPDRIWYVADAFRAGMSVQEVYRYSGIDPWFLEQIRDLVHTEDSLKTVNLADIDYRRMFSLKRKGFSDERLAVLLAASEAKVREHRHGLGVRPVYKRVDTCAAVFHL
jgi:carbamoyl-phosphate synthase large subunit